MHPTPPWEPEPYRPPPGSGPPVLRGPPGPVAAVSVLLYVLAALSVLVAAVGAVVGVVSRELSELDPTRWTDVIAAYASGGAGLLVLLAVLDIVLGIFLWKGRRWAMITTLVVAGLMILLAFRVPFPAWIALNVVVGSLIVVLLMAPPASRAHFAPPGRPRRG